MSEEEPVGSLAEEAVRLLGALGDWARDQGATIPGDLGGVAAGVAGHAADAVRDADAHLATGAAECTWCPLCRTVHAVRQTSPEVRDQLLVAATALLQAGTGLLAALSARADSSDADAAARPSGSRVERIDLDLDDEDHDGGAGTGPAVQED